MYRGVIGWFKGNISYSYNIGEIFFNHKDETKKIGEIIGWLCQNNSAIIENPLKYNKI